MSSLIANKFRTNMCFSFCYTRFFVHTNLCASVQTYTTYTTMITTITILSLFLFACNLFARHTCTLFFSHNYSLLCSQFFFFCKRQHFFVRSSQEKQQLHAALTELLLTATCFVLPLQKVLQVEGSYYFMCHCSNLQHVYHNNYNNNCLFRYSSSAKSTQNSNFFGIH